MNMRTVRRALFVWLALAILAPAGPARALRLRADNVTHLAIYGPGLDAARSLAPNQINYNVTSASWIKDIIDDINFSQAQNCRTMGSLLNAIVYARFSDGSVARFQVFNQWTQFSPYGTSTTCFPVGPDARFKLQLVAQ